MRQKDVDLLTTIWTAEVEEAQLHDMPGFQMTGGAVLKPLAYSSDPSHPLDLSRLEGLINRARARELEER